MALPDVYESSDLCLAIGLSPSFLNRLVERGLHGIKPSLRAERKYWWSQMVL